MSRFQNRPGHRWYGHDRQGDRYSRRSPRTNANDRNLERPRQMLVAVKEGMLHPKLPTYRRQDMDDSLHKLPIEHCRTSTSRSHHDFQYASISLYNKTKQPLPEQLTRSQLSALNEEGPSSRESERAQTSVGREEKTFTRQSQRPQTNVAFGGGLRRMHLDELAEKFPAYRREPDESSFLRRYKFHYIPPRIFPEQYYKPHFVDWTGMRPTPANTYSRYRDAHPKYSENISSTSWRP